MELAELGYNNYFENSKIKLGFKDFEAARIIAEHKERYLIKTSNGDYEAEITGNLRFSANNRSDFPVVGDWAATTIFEPDTAIIHKILPRTSAIKRKVSGNSSEEQIIAANVDFALLVQGLDRDFNINRLERYLTICYSSRVSPIIIFTKTDLVKKEYSENLLSIIKLRIKNVPFFSLSNYTLEGYEDFLACLSKGKTYCMLGSSGAGKSTLLNNLKGEYIMRTNEISASTQKGRHTTTHRELFILENGALLIDNPGMKEVGITVMDENNNTTFTEIAQYSQDCKFSDCSHSNETGCAVTKAVKEGLIDKNSYLNYQKLVKENSYYISSVEERRRKDKAFGKLIKNYKKNLNNSKNFS